MRNSLADVVTAALRVLDAQGLEGCSMRQVAAEIGVRPSALYHHVPNKQTLLALMADQIVAGVGARARSGAGDRALQARHTCEELRAAMLAIHDGADVVATAAAFRMGSSRIEDDLAELVGRDGARTLLIYTFGQAQSTQTHRRAAAFGVLLGESEIPGAPAGEDDGVDNLDASFARGLDIILAGLAAQRA